MEYGSIERTIRVDASPEVVYEVISSPAHMREWWNGVDADIEPKVGYAGDLAWGDRASGEGHVEGVTVVEAEPPHRFAFRWVYGDATVPQHDNSLLVTFVLTAADDGTVLTMTETGFRERGWEAAQLEAAYAEHLAGWDRHLGDLERYLERLGSAA